MKLLIPLLLLTTSPLVADCFSWEFGARMGYRWDKLEHSVFSEEGGNRLAFRESFDNLSTAQIGGFTKLRLWWLEASVDINYGWTVGGHVRSKPFFHFDGLGTRAATFKSDANGEVWDAFFIGGLRVPFYDYCDQELLITPLGGWSLHGMREKRRDLRPESRNIGEVPFFGVGTSSLAFVSLPSTTPLKRDYQGPFAGLSMSILYHRFYTSFGYAYHWIDLEQNLSIVESIESFEQNRRGVLTLDLSNRCKPKRNRGNRGWVSLNYEDPCGFCAGLCGTYFSVSTRKKDGVSPTMRTITINSDTFENSQQGLNAVNTSWNTFTVMVEAAYEF